MDHQDRQAIEGLFSKLGEVERQAGPRDGEAEALIRARITAQPGAPYFMAQTIVIQEQALNAAQARIEELERALASRPAGGGGLLSGLFGGGQPQRPSEPRPGYPTGSAGNPAMAGTPWGGAGPTAGAQPGRGGFLAGAAQTAMGVAGGMMIGSMLGSAFGGGGANAADAAKPAPEPAAENDGGDLGFSNDDI